MSPLIPRCQSVMRCFPLRSMQRVRAGFLNDRLFIMHTLFAEIIANLGVKINLCRYF